jgi:hypothetical protein
VKQPHPDFVPTSFPDSGNGVEPRSVPVGNGVDGTKSVVKTGNEVEVSGTKSRNEVRADIEPVFARNQRMRERGSPSAAGGSGVGSWCTPKWLADMIGTFDLDPCSNPRSHVRATKRLALETGDDGLDISTVQKRTQTLSAQAWWGLRVFINPPYERGSVLRWLDAYRHTRWCFLLRFDPSTEWFGKIYDAAELIAVPRGRRVNFEPPPGVKASSNAIAHALYWRHAADAPDAVIRNCVCWRKRSRP